MPPADDQQHVYSPAAVSELAEQTSSITFLSGKSTVSEPSIAQFARLLTINAAKLLIRQSRLQIARRGVILNRPLKLVDLLRPNRFRIAPAAIYFIRHKSNYMPSSQL